VYTTLANNGAFIAYKFISNPRKGIFLKTAGHVPNVHSHWRMLRICVILIRFKQPGFVLFFLPFILHLRIIFYRLKKIFLIQYVSWWCLAATECKNSTNASAPTLKSSNPWLEGWWNKACQIHRTIRLIVLNLQPPFLFKRGFFRGAYD
jgi:hypothetical protein